MTYQEAFEVYRNVYKSFFGTNPHYYENREIPRSVEGLLRETKALSEAVAYDNLLQQEEEAVAILPLPEVSTPRPALQAAALWMEQYAW